MHPGFVAGGHGEPAELGNKHCVCCCQGWPAHRCPCGARGGERVESKTGTDTPTHRHTHAQTQTQTQAHRYRQRLTRTLTALVRVRSLCMLAISWKGQKGDATALWMPAPLSGTLALLTTSNQGSFRRLTNSNTCETPRASTNTTADLASSNHQHHLPSSLPPSSLFAPLLTACSPPHCSPPHCLLPSSLLPSSLLPSSLFAPPPRGSGQIWTTPTSAAASTARAPPATSE